MKSKSDILLTSHAMCVVYHICHIVSHCQTSLFLSANQGLVMFSMVSRKRTRLSSPQRLQQQFHVGQNLAVAINDGKRHCHSYIPAEMGNQLYQNWGHRLQLPLTSISSVVDFQLIIFCLDSLSHRQHVKPPNTPHCMRS